MTNKNTVDKLIPFISQLGQREQARWLAALAAAMPMERVLPVAQLTVQERRQARVAVVANPDPKGLKCLPNLAWVHSLWAGVEHLVADLQNQPVDVVRLVDPQLAHTMAEAVLAWTLYLHRDMHQYAKQQRAHIWRQLPYKRPQQRTVSLMGLGAMGKAAAVSLQQAGFRVCGWSRTQKAIPGITTFCAGNGLHAMVEQSDILVCLLPLTAATRGLLNANLLSRLPFGAMLINFSRGPILNNQDLLAQLEKGSLSYAVLDVFYEEPLPASSALWNHQQITVLPHISAQTDHNTAASIVAENIRNYRISGCIPPVVDKARGY